MSYLPIIYNLTLLISVVVIHHILLRKLPFRSFRFRLLSGLLFGLATIVSMFSAWDLSEGFLLDGRFIILGIAGAFGGPLTAGLAAAIAMGCRIILGGSGAFLGLFGILLSALIGTGMYYLRQSNPKASSPWAFLVLGLLIHLLIFFSVIWMPGGLALAAFRSIALPVLLFYPLAALLLGWMFLDQEARLRLLNELSQSEERFRQIFLGSSTVLMILDPDNGRILEVNQAAERFYGYTAGEMARMRITHINLLPWEQTREKIQASVSGQQTRFLLKHRLANGNLRDVEVHAGPVKVGNKQLVLSTIHDVSDRIRSQQALIKEQKRLQEVMKELEKEKKKAEEANLAKSEFLANMSHEIRTPMNAILGFSEALYERLNQPAQKKMLESVLSSGKLLLSLLNDILDLSKIEAGRLAIHQTPTALPTVIEEMKILFQDKTREKNLDLIAEVPDDFPPALDLDEMRIKQVLFNLVGNAVKFTREGQIRMALSFTPQGDTAGLLRMVVEDTGIGIPEEHQEIIFKPFFQESKQTSRRFGGTGLGLAITSRLVEHMKGDISLKSTFGKGSVFTVTLPGVTISRQQSRLTHAPTTATDFVFEKGLVLVVDDSVANLELLHVFLSSSGLDTLLAESGEMALDIMEKQVPDLILLDILMPGMDGFQVAKKLKQDPRFQHIPLVAFTAFVHDSEKIEHSGLFSGYLYKPVKRQAVLKMVAKHLAHGELAVTQPQTPDTESRSLPLPELSQVPGRVMEQIPALITRLRSHFMPEWERLKDQWVLFKIEAFAQDLNQTAQASGLDYLTAYARQLLEKTDTLDLEGLRPLMHEFPRILTHIEALAAEDKPTS